MSGLEGAPLRDAMQAAIFTARGSDVWPAWACCGGSWPDIRPWWEFAEKYAYDMNESHGYWDGSWCGAEKFNHGDGTGKREFKWRCDQLKMLFLRLCQPPIAAVSSVPPSGAKTDPIPWQAGLFLLQIPLVSVCSRRGVPENPVDSGCHPRVVLPLSQVARVRRIIESP